MTTVKSNASSTIPHVYYLGSYLPDYSRHRIIQAGLRSLGISVIETRDRSAMPLRWWRLARVLHAAPFNAPIIVGEASNFLFPLLLEARLQEHPVVYDVFVPAQDAVQDEREADDLWAEQRE